MVSQSLQKVPHETLLHNVMIKEISNLFPTFHRISQPEKISQLLRQTLVEA